MIEGMKLLSLFLFALFFFRYLLLSGLAPFAFILVEDLLAADFFVNFISLLDRNENFGEICKYSQLFIRFFKLRSDSNEIRYLLFDLILMSCNNILDFQEVRRMTLLSQQK